MAILWQLMRNSWQYHGQYCGNSSLSLHYHQLGVPKKAEITLFEPDPDNAGVGRQFTLQSYSLIDQFIVHWFII